MNEGLSDNQVYLRNLKKTNVAHLCIKGGGESEAYFRTESKSHLRAGSGAYFPPVRTDQKTCLSAAGIELAVYFSTAPKAIGGDWR